MNDETIEQPQLLETEAQISIVPRSAEDVAKSILAWAKENNLFSKAPTDDGIDLGSADLSALPARMQAVSDISGILRKRAINLVAYSNEQRKVTIFTNGKVSKAEIKLLPFAGADGIQIDYVQGGVAQVRAPDDEADQPRPYVLRSDRVCCGSSVYPVDAMGAGTLGVLVRDHEGTLFGLTNNHVSGGCNSAYPGLPIICPGPLDAKDCEMDPFTIGRHTKLLPVNDGLPENINTAENCDAALIRISNPDRVSSFQRNQYDTPPVAATPVGGMRVEKSGRTTATTRGQVVGFSASPVPVAYSIPEYGIRKTVFFNEVMIIKGDNDAPFSKAGDSGSLVVGYDQQGQRVAVGLVFAGNEERGLSFALPLANILTLLGVSLVSSHNADGQ
jgi:hypothetical protein